MAEELPWQLIGTFVAAGAAVAVAALNFRTNRAGIQLSQIEAGMNLLKAMAEPNEKIAKGDLLLLRARFYRAMRTELSTRALPPILFASFWGVVGGAILEFGHNNGRSWNLFVAGAGGLVLCLMNVVQAVARLDSGEVQVKLRLRELEEETLLKVVGKAPPPDIEFPRFMSELTTFLRDHARWIRVLGRLTILFLFLAIAVFYFFA